ncbi:MAG: hypothetical protein D6E12_03330 [Desulfovibrio sp.]|nr:MAG: hypothetical protein D6E12_03330 [Desulfovibrio sp.]
MRGAVILEVRASGANERSLAYLADLAQGSLAAMGRSLPEASRFVATDSILKERLAPSHAGVEFLSIDDSYWCEELPCLRVTGHEPLARQLQEYDPDYALVVPGPSADADHADLLRARDQLFAQDALVCLGLVPSRDNLANLKHYARTRDINLLHVLETDPKVRAGLGCSPGILLTRPFSLDPAQGAMPLKRFPGGHASMGPVLLSDTCQGLYRYAIASSQVPVAMDTLVGLYFSPGMHVTGWVVQEPGERVTFYPGLDAQPLEQWQLRISMGTGDHARLHMAHSRSCTHEVAFSLPVECLDHDTLPFALLSQCPSMLSNVLEPLPLTEPLTAKEPLGENIVNLQTNQRIKGRQDAPRVYSAKHTLCAFRSWDGSVLRQVLDKGHSTTFVQKQTNSLCALLSVAPSSRTNGQGHNPDTSSDSVTPLDHLEKVAANTPNRQLPAQPFTLGAHILKPLEEARSAHIRDQGLEAEPTGRLLLEHAFGHGSLKRPAALLAHDSQLIVADVAHSSLLVFSHKGKLVDRWELGLKHATHVFELDGRIGVCDCRNARLLRFDPKTKSAESLMIRDYVPEGYPHTMPSFAFARDERLFLVASSLDPHDKRLISIDLKKGPKGFQEYDGNNVLALRQTVEFQGKILAGDYNFPRIHALDEPSRVLRPLSLGLPASIRSMDVHEDTLYVATPGFLLALDRDFRLGSVVSLPELTSNAVHCLEHIQVCRDHNMLYGVDKGKRTIVAFSLGNGSVPQ